MKKILIIYYSQTGQLKGILDSIARPLSEQFGFSVDFLKIEPEEAFPFPWTRMTFLQVFPESVREVPVPLQNTFAEPSGGYDLIVLGFQPWYLSPSIPVTSFLKSPEAERLLRGADVVTVIGSRNMWLHAYQRVAALVETLGGRLRGNIALSDQAKNLVSVVTIVYWMFTGKKDRYLGIFPVPGISEADIAHAAVFGQTIGEALTNGDMSDLSHALEALGASELNDSLARLENRAKKIFKVWAGLMINRPKARPLLLNLFFIELVLGLLVLSPLTAFGGAIRRLWKKSS